MQTNATKSSSPQSVPSVPSVVKNRPVRFSYSLTQRSGSSSGIVHTVITRAIARTRAQAERQFFGRQLRAALAQEDL